MNHLVRSRAQRAHRLLVLICSTYLAFVSLRLHKTDFFDLITRPPLKVQLYIVVVHKEICMYFVMRAPKKIVVEPGVSSKNCVFLSPIL